MELIKFTLTEETTTHYFFDITFKYYKLFGGNYNETKPYFKEKSSHIIYSLCTNIPLRNFDETIKAILSKTDKNYERD